MNVAVVGARGRLGSIACDALEAADDLDLVARVGRGDDLSAAFAADVAVEVTGPATVRTHAAALLDAGVHTVVGASGLDDDGLADLASRAGRARCLVVPNFSVGAVLLMRLAADVARVLPHAEVVEAHHDRKVDAPSGTAVQTARGIAAARAAAPPQAGPPDQPARGLVVDGVAVHSLRLPGVLASQEVVFGGPGQTLTLRHDTFDRAAAFAPGILLAVRGVAGLDGFATGLDALL